MTRLKFAAAALAVVMSAMTPVASQAKAIKTISGLIQSDGAILAGDGYLVIRNSVGDYTIVFGKGAFNGVPVVTCTAAGILSLLAICNVASTIQFADGSATIGIRLYARSSGKIEDNNFTFTEITAPLPKGQ